MAPKKYDLIRELYIYDLSTNKSICQCKVEKKDKKPDESESNSDSDTEEEDINNTNYANSDTTSISITTVAVDTQSHKLQAAVPPYKKQKLTLTQSKLSFAKTVDESSTCSIDNIITDTSLRQLTLRKTKSKQKDRSSASITSESSTTSKSKELCLKILKGNKATNLKKHVRLNHPRQYNEYLKQTAAVSVSKKLEESTSNCITQKPDPLQSTLFNFFGKQTFNVSLSRNKIINGILKIICQGCRPFSMLEEEGFRDIFDPIFDAMGFRISRFNIIDYIHEQYTQIKSKLTNLISKKLVSIKVDCASRMERSFIGINIQFVRNGKIIVFTLSAIELSERHTGENLKSRILDELEKYGVGPSQIYTITCDGGSNLKKACQLINDNLGFIEQDSDDEIDESIEPEGDKYNELFNSTFCESLKDDFIISIRCAVHTLQLSVMDTLSNKHKNHTLTSYLNVIDSARKVVKELRTQNVLLLVRSKGLKKAILDCATRWSFTYDMLKLLYDEYRNFCEEFKLLNSKLNLSIENWEVINEIIICLEPSRIATKKLQAEELTLTDVYRILNICQIETNKIGSAFALDLVDNFIKRRACILESDPYYASLYLDPRFSFKLCKADKERAIKHLVRVYNKYIALQNERNETTLGDISDASSVNSNSNSAIEYLDDDELAEKLYEKSLLQKRRNLKSNTLDSKAAPNFEVVCRSFGNIDLYMKSRDSILQFWLQNKALYPEMSLVADIVFAVPATQVSVERLFSQLKFLLSYLRYNLKSDTINEILVIKNNLSKFESYFD